MKFEYKDPEYPSGLNEATDPELVYDVDSFIQRLQTKLKDFKKDDYYLTHIPIHKKNLLEKLLKELHMAVFNFGPEKIKHIDDRKDNITKKNIKNIDEAIGRSVRKYLDNNDEPTSFTAPKIKDKDIIKFIESLKDDKMSFKIDKNDCLDWVIKQIKQKYKG